MPHVFAGSDEDAWRSVGYLQARDRLWQMELYRRAASGRLSELLGEATIAVDKRFLVLGLRRAAEIEWQRVTPRVRRAFESYAAGVNAAMNVGREQTSPRAPTARSSTGAMDADRFAGDRKAVRLAAG